VKLASRATLGETRRVVMLGPSPVTMLDIVGPLEVFSIANQLSGVLPAPYSIEMVAAGTKDIVGTSGLLLRTATTCHRVRAKVDTLLIAGGEGARKLDDPRALAWIRTVAKTARRVGSICTGVFLLAKAGVLKDQRVTTHWAWADELRRLYPKLRVDADPVWIRDGKIYTSAGITTGMDLALELVAEDLGRSFALRVARHMVLFLHRPGGQAQFSVLLAKQTSETKPFHDLGIWMIENLHRNLSIEALALRVGMSPRNFCRVFAREHKVTPGYYVQRLRLEAARRQLEQTSRGLKEIALDCGFGTDEAMRCTFLRLLRTTPGSYRKRFRLEPAA
jgi:transcriptional regulator GlxA family with amidase domain